MTDPTVQLRFRNKAAKKAFLRFRKWWERELKQRRELGLDMNGKGLHGPRALVDAEVVE